MQDGSESIVVRIYSQKYAACVKLWMVYAKILTTVKLVIPWI